MNQLTEKVTHHPFFHGMKSSHLAVLTECATEAKFKPGTVVFGQGEPANKLYLIESGKVALEAADPAHGPALVQYLSAGEVLGWSWLFPPYSWSCGARATEETQLIVLSGAHLLNAAERDHDFGYELMKRVAQVVIHRLQATRRRVLALRIASDAKS